MQIEINHLNKHFPSFNFFMIEYHRIIEHPELERTHRDHQKMLEDSLQNSHLCFNSKHL